MKNRMQKSRAICTVMLILMTFVICTPFVFAENGLNGVGTSNTTNTTVTQQTAGNTVTNTETAPQTQTVTQPVTNTGNTTSNVGATTGTTSDTTGISSIPNTYQDPEKVEETADALGGMFAQAGPDAEDISKANKFIEPVSKILNMVMAVILGLTSLLMMLITVLDLLYMAFPPIRNHLDGGRMNMAGQGGRGSRGMGRGMNRGYGMGGMGMNSMGMNNMGMGGMDMGMPQQQPQQANNMASTLGRWVSDEAIAACMEAQAVGPGMPMKSMIFSYMKKRALFLILFGVCVVLFTSTVFTDLGIRLGSWFLQLFLGFSS